MAGDDKDKDEGFDPWADLASEPTPSLDEGFSFSFEEATLDAGLSEPAEQPERESAEEPSEELISQPLLEAAEDRGEVAAPAAAADDDLVTSWLDETADEPMAEQPLAVFSPDDHPEGDSINAGPDGDAGPDPELDLDASEDAAVAGLSSIEIGTGESGVHSPSSIDPFNAIADDASPEAIEAVETIAFSFADEQPAEVDSADAAEVLDFGSAATGVAVAAAAAAASPSAKASRKATPKKKGGLGQMLGIVMGGAMAIPITLAILIWGFQKDPFKVTKHVPESVAFLLPQKFQRGGGKQVAGGPDLSTAPTLDDLPSAETAVVDTPPAEPAAAEEPATEETATGEIAGSAPEPDVASVASSAPVQPRGLDELLQEPAAVEPQVPPAPVVPEPEPLDVSGLEQAVADSAAALDAVKASGDPVRKTRLVEWYKQLARMAQELAMLERIAADSGRPLTATPDTVAGLHATILAQPELIDDLARLSRNWLAYAKRGGDGLVMPATFTGSRQVGPYWSSRVTIAEAGGGARELSIISRAEPAALPGDVILITGLAMDGDVVWASDMRSTTAADANGAAAEPAAVQPAEPDPFGLPPL
ncbi:MAG: hypothetical protein K8S94_07855 [Planctomycetia bacterium]|nr:hypothetical protein [Planctomycetia bacterium]